MIAVTTASRIEGYQIVAYKCTAQGATFNELLKNAESLAPNAVLNTCYDDALDVDTLFHGPAVIIELFLPIQFQHTESSAASFQDGGQSEP